jgi:hypothetical protein
MINPNHIQSHNAVVYYINDHNKINGSFYYAFEYFYLLQQHSLCTLYIVAKRKLKEDEILSLNAIKDKYDIEEIDIQFCTTVQMYTYNVRKALFVDVSSYKRLRGFVRGEHFVYSNETHDNYRSPNGTTYFGYYDYQKFDIKSTLKLNFSIFKQIENCKTETTFLSYVNKGKSDSCEIAVIAEKYNLKNILMKSDIKIIKNLFNIIDQIVYVHIGLDTNNRIIVEAAWYNIPIIIEERTTIEDSTTLRQKDIKDGQLQKYTLDKNDLMVQTILKD